MKHNFFLHPIELEQTGSQAGGEIEFGTLSIFGTKDKNKEHLSLSEITCVCRIAGEKTLAIHTPARSFLLMPLILKFDGDLDMEEWQSEITAGMNSVMKTQSRPNSGNQPLLSLFEVDAFLCRGDGTRY